ncbi:hypothetical protein LWF15_20200 [Kineosporia rhizophila]|uniref:hypothetical protein n=1 Tax=Kineosporia rhizophila TaxID=84633 RepID=UPI000A792646|nr:hypothetical protein [Kineosporia rhizophila]MCE0537819.1 hypothetical protein [Kineosporia rhizophila]
MKKLLAGILVACILGIGALAGGGYFLFKLFTKSTVSPQAYSSVQVGDTREAVRADISDAVEFTEADVFGAGKSDPEPTPKGADCELYMSSDVTDASGNLYYRFCFRDGQLVEKTTVSGA